MFYDINILVNGSRCKQYHHQGRTFVEAKDGSEYSIEIKNNAWRRILACCSVDGLNILDGKTATENGPGYVINGHSSNKYEGFRVSDSHIAKFTFGQKGESYAASKENGAERNVGVIGVRLFEEFIEPQPFYKNSDPRILKEQKYCSNTADPLPEQPTIWGITAPTTDATLDWMKPDYDKGSPTGGRGDMRSIVETSNLYSGEVNPRGFDMGTKWGGAKESKIVEVEFEKGLLAVSTDIYYASRQSLIEMGVPTGNEKQVNFPSSFADAKYAKPPKNWKG